MPQSKSETRDDPDPVVGLRDETTHEQRGEDNGGAPPGVARRADVGQRDGRLPRERGESPPLRDREPGHEPDVFVDVPKVKVDELYLAGKGLDAHVSLRAEFADLVQVTAGVHVHFGEVELDAKGVEAEARMKVWLENLSDILECALTTIDRNPQILQTLLKTVESAVDDRAEAVGDTAEDADARADEAAEPLGGVRGTSVGPAPEQATQQVTEAATKATERAAEAAVEAAGRASWTSKEQDRGKRPAAEQRRSGQTETKSGSKRGRARVRSTAEPGSNSASSP